MAVRLILFCAAAAQAVPTTVFPQDEAADPGHLTRVAAVVEALGRIDQVRSAPEQRAWQTATVFAPGAVIDEALRDADFGRWRGRDLLEIQAAEPEGIAAWLADMAVAPHGGDSLQGVVARAAGWLDHHRDTGTTVAVTHPSVIRAAIVHALGAPPEAFRRIDVEPLSLADLRFYGGHWTLRSLGPALP